MQQVSFYLQTRAANNRRKSTAVEDARHREAAARQLVDFTFNAKLSNV